mmetsp:Transcript_29698/g.91853  ORF Transcript_29698/g.91853 Transcript_29698/m.91853 type:complete len:248 (+) Transcript_29698:1576-2319(+)
MRYGFDLPPNPRSARSSSRNNSRAASKSLSRAPTSPVSTLNNPSSNRRVDRAQASAAASNRPQPARWPPNGLSSLRTASSVPDPRPPGRLSKNWRPAAAGSVAVALRSASSRASTSPRPGRSLGAKNVALYRQRADAPLTDRAALAGSAPSTLATTSNGSANRKSSVRGASAMTSCPGRSASSSSSSSSAVKSNVSSSPNTSSRDDGADFCQIEAASPGYSGGGTANENLGTLGSLEAACSNALRYE